MDERLASRLRSRPASVPPLGLRREE
ncbi:jg1529, partial [Pararge aegeria aegeria]